MFRWVPYPFLRFTPALVGGILLSVYTDISTSVGVTLCVIIAYAIAVVTIPAKQQRIFSAVLGMSGLLIIALIGTIRVQQQDEARHSQHLLRYDKDYTHYVATVTAAAESRKNSWRTLAHITHVLPADSSQQHITTPVVGSILLYQPLADSTSLLQYGDYVLIRGQPNEISPPTNPNAFDQRRYWANQQIYHQHYVRTEDWVRIKNAPAYAIDHLAQWLRQQGQRTLSVAVGDAEARSIALALILGVKDQLNDQIKNAYAHAGAMHVLAVSGLHIGIVYGVLAFLLMPLGKGRRGRILRAIISIGTLWLFALVTGGSVSVVRAATMFTCVVLAETMQRRSNIFNTLALSAFILLLINPYYLFSVGFQLSYLAVLGIVYLQPRFYDLITFRTWWADKIWGLTAVSLAAQVATLPVSLYYFHQFPTYFWLANLLVIPAAFVILSLGLLTLGVGWWHPVVLSRLGQVLEYVIRGVNYLIYQLEKLPFSHIDGLQIDLPQVLVGYAALVAVAMLFYYRKFRYLLYTCGCIMVLIGFRLNTVWQQSQRRTVTFYDIKKQSSVDFTAGIANYHWGVWNEQSDYQIAPHHLHTGLRTHLLDADSGQHLVPLVQRPGMTLAVWQGQRIAFVHDRPPQPNAEVPKLSVDCLVVCDNAIRQLSHLNHRFDYQMLIIDSSNSPYRVRQLTEEAESLQIAYHAVPIQGAYQWEVK